MRERSKGRCVAYKTLVHSMQSASPLLLERARQLRIVQLSDTHISHLGGTPVKNFWLLIDYINGELHPDLVINTGDVVILHPDSVEDRDTAWRLHQRVDVPLRVLPGNHDVGDTGEKPWMGLSVTSERIDGFKSTWGADRFVLLGLAADGAEDRAFIGINSQVMSSGLPEETEHWEWLESVGLMSKASRCCCSCTSHCGSQDALSPA
jgi:predicted MPP superfamily phosphohydrolase